MAQAANKDKVRADMKPVDYRGAMKRMECLPGKRNKAQKVAKEIDDVSPPVKRITAVDKDAAKIYAALAKKDEADRLRICRDLNGLIDAAGWPEEDADMVDQAQGNVVKMRLPEGDDGGIDEEIEELGGDAEPAEDPGGVDEVTEEISEEAEQSEDDGFTEMTEEELAAQKPCAEAAEKAEAEGGEGSKKSLFEKMSEASKAREAEEAKEPDES